MLKQLLPLNVKDQDHAHFSNQHKNFKNQKNIISKEKQINSGKDSWSDLMRVRTETPYTVEHAITGNKAIPP
jgi:hypothetical protein